MSGAGWGAAAAAIWVAVDAITKPSTVRVERGDLAEDLDIEREAIEKAIAEAVAAGESLEAATVRLRRPLLVAAGESRKRSEVPSLWDRASEALATGAEGGTRSPLATRSPCDVDLMEIRNLIRETVIHELVERKVPIKKTDTVPMLIRRLAGYVIGREPDRLWWYEYRFAQWARLLETYLRAVLDEQAKSVRLINTACTECGTRQVRVEAEDGHQLVPALMAEFREGAFRAIVCAACAATSWRGDDLETLAAKIAAQPRLVRSSKEDGRVPQRGLRPDTPMVPVVRYA